MTTYRTGNHWGVTIVREGDPAESVHLIRDGDATAQCCGKTPFELPGTDRLTTDPGLVACLSPASQLVAVVVNGDQALAERIAWLLTHTCATCMGPQRETVGMVCQTCGTDYGPADLEPAPSAETIAAVIAIADAPYQPGLDFRPEDDA
jgi:hypothetical protein